MELDRDLQRRILEKLRECYPAPSMPQHIGALGDADTIGETLYYLKEHDLIDCLFQFSSDGRNTLRWVKPKLTAKGMDFLADDGGLTAILGTVTVRLHADTVRELIAAKVQADANLPAEKKSSLLAAIKRMPETALQELTKRLLQEGLDRWPDAIALLQKLLGL